MLSNFVLYSQQQQGRSGMRFAILLESGVLRVFNCPVLVEDTRENLPTPMVVARLGDSGQGSTYIAIDQSVFTKTALVLMSQRNGTVFSATKQSTVVVNRKDEAGDKVKREALYWTGF